MSKKVKIIIAVMVLLAIGGAVYYFMVYQPKKFAEKLKTLSEGVDPLDLRRAPNTDLASAPPAEAQTETVANASMIKTVQPKKNDAIVLA